tara:strand:+ start:162 stop:755 length:594 start_codon:yes stop_codon:yes gene_type:complete
MLSFAPNSCSTRLPNQARVSIDSEQLDEDVSGHINSLSLSDATKPRFGDQGRSQNVWAGEIVLEKLFKCATKDKQFYVIPHSGECDAVVNTRLEDIKSKEDNKFVSLYKNVSKGQKLDFEHYLKKSMEKITNILFVEDLPMAITMGKMYIERSFPNLSNEQVADVSQISEVLEFLDTLEESTDTKHILVILDMDFPD